MNEASNASETEKFFLQCTIQIALANSGITSLESENTLKESARETFTVDFLL